MKEVFGVEISIYEEELDDQEILKDTIYRVAKCLQDKQWLWMDIKQFNISRPSWDKGSDGYHYEVQIYFNHYYRESDVTFFVAECAKFGNASVYKLEVP